MKPWRTHGRGETILCRSDRTLWRTVTKLPTRAVMGAVLSAGRWLACAATASTATCSVTVDELIQMVNIALGNSDISTCLAGDANADGMIEVNEIIAAVSNGLNACS